MGLTIHYSGKLKNASDLKLLIDEVKDVAVAENWKFYILEEAYKNDSFSEIIDKENLYGILISPPNCEPLSFTFLSNGRMSGLINFNMMERQQTINEELLYSVFTKTQYAGYEIHKKLILLLEYISKKYLADFECIDEAKYWETRDEDFLKNSFETHTNIINSFASAAEMIPVNKNESIEDYLIRISQNVKNEDDDFPKLTIEQENEFKKMKLSLEHDAIFPDIPKMKLPPEIEGMFLDNIFDFEEKMKNAKRISVYDKIGKPNFIPSDLLNDDEISIELERIEKLLHANNLTLDVTCDYDDEKRLIYTFITEELFEHEFDDIDIPDIFTHFHYEEFHPNDEYDIENTCHDFLTIFLNIKNDLYEKYYDMEALNHEELNNFRSLFRKFKIKSYNFDTLIIEDDTAKATFDIDFWGKIKGTDSKIYYSGKGEMTFKHEFGFWYVQIVKLPIMD